jgi:hypothetical protein
MEFLGVTMPIFKYVKVLLLTPGIGSVLICLLGLLLSVALISQWGRSGDAAHIGPGQAPARSGSIPAAPSGSKPGSFHSVGESKSIELGHPPAIRPSTSQRTVTQRTSRAANNPPGIEAQDSMVNGILRPNGAEQKSRNAPGMPSLPPLDRAIFQKSITKTQLEFLNDYAGRPAYEVVRERRIRELVNMVVPYTPFHFGLDMPLPNAIEAILSGSPTPVEIREGRYMMVSTQGGRGAARGFIWLDMQEGIALGGIFFHPTNGEPTPTLTLFSKQVKQDSVDMGQLPVAFAQDLSQWAAMAGIPPITTRYFINASSEKIVLAHDEDFCRRAEGMPAVPEDVCKQMNANAAEVDIKAAHFLDQTHYASNATMRMTGDRSAVDR